MVPSSRSNPAMAALTPSTEPDTPSTTATSARATVSRPMPIATTEPLLMAPLMSSPAVVQPKVVADGKASDTALATPAKSVAEEAK